jgi:hypothetical protein
LPPTLFSLIGVESEHPMIGHDLTRPEFASWPGRAIMQYGDTQAYMQGREVAILRKDLPAAVFAYDPRVGLRREPDDPELIAAAIAHATWTSATYADLRYRSPGTSLASADRSAVALAQRREQLTSISP